MTEEQIRETFRYHSPNPESIKTHEAIREMMTETTLFVAAQIPNSRERSLFITHMHHAQMMANAAVAIHGLPPKDEHPSVVVVVNGKEHLFVEGENCRFESDFSALVVSYDELRRTIGRCMGPDVAITWRRADSDSAHLLPGQSMTLIEGTVINITSTHSA